MKYLVLLTTGLMMALATSCKTYNGLILSIEPSATPPTSESVPFHVVFMNTGDSTLSVLKPVMGRDLVIHVFDENNNELTLSTSKSEYSDIYWGDTPKPRKEYTKIKSGEIWKSESFDLFIDTYPSFRLVPDQTVRMEAIYSLKGKEFEINTTFDIPAHDTEIKPEYISGDEALALATQNLIKIGFAEDAINELKITVQCINGTYRVTYSHPNPPPRVRGRFSFTVKIDPISDEILQGYFH